MDSTRLFEHEHRACRERDVPMTSARKYISSPLILALALIAPSRPAFAQVDGPHVVLFPWGGYANFAKNVNIKDKPLFGGTAGLFVHKYVGVEAHLGYLKTNTITGFTHYSIDPAPAILVPEELSMLHYGGDLVLNLHPSAWFSPYVLGGWQEGRIKFEDEVSRPRAEYENGWEFGAGARLHLSPRVAVRAEFRDAMWKFPEGTPPPAGSDATDNQFYTAGVEFTFGGKSITADADHDGVPDRKDKCPDTPIGARVDASGCPLDSDGDGVWDGIDQCPDTPHGATVDAKGCPNDADNDGVPDGIDQCPNTPAGAVVDARGCPKDSDNDGVPDGIDQCADTPAGAKVDARGCPIVEDSDHDGVPDDKDLCPNTPTDVKVDKDGCPITLNERETELLDKGRITERNIHFVTAKWDILPESYPILDDIGSILIQWPRLQIEIGGHCDSRGSDAYNMDLSDKRANSVMTYLITKYPQLDRGHFTAKGYGERVPVATNKTVEGMAMNRRVEFKVLNEEELKRERERRSTIKKTD
jgi:outer membrane protein OmpA-like peptidoglycan-associated protein/opacity protein-like surface antigen